MKENNINSVLGITVGPIYELMRHAKKTREIWFSSFFFSWYVKELIKKLEGNITLILPQEYNDLMKNKTNIGRFPDHIIGKSQLPIEDCRVLIEKIISETNNFFIELIDKTIVETKTEILSSNKTINEIFNSYVQTKYIVLDHIEGTKEKQIVKKVESHLSALECYRAFPLGKNENTCYRCKSLPSVVAVRVANEQKTKQNLCPFCFLKLRCNQSDIITEETGQKKGKMFPPLFRIVTRDLERNEKYKIILDKYEEKDEDDYLNPKDFKGDLKSFHKYLSIIQADGDNLGKVLESDKVDLKTLDVVLNSFVDKATNIFSSFSANPIYIGGDDFLAFLPTINTINGEFKTAIDVANELSQTYMDCFKDINAGSETKTTLSVGVNISYYKQPLSLALDKAYIQLNEEAKKVPGKNSLALLLTQHSGQQTSLTFEFGSTRLNKFNEMLTKFVKEPRSFPHSIHHKLVKYKSVLTNLYSSEQLDHFIENRFNEEIHQSMDFKSDVIEYLKLYMNYSVNGSEQIYKGQNAVTAIEQFLSDLRFIKFLVRE